MPALSPTMTTGNLGEWVKQVGDEVNAGDVLVGIETDKAQMDFECQDEGFMAKILMEGNKKDVPVNTPLAILCEEKDDIEKFKDFKFDESVQSSASQPEPAKNAEEVKKAPETTAAKDSPKGSRIFSTPAAKFVASSKDVDLSQVKGSGPSGRILKKDVESFSAPVVAPKAVSSKPIASKEVVSEAEYSDIPLSNVRKVIAARLSESKSTIPHYYLTIELNVDRVLKLREVLNKEANGTYKLSLNDFVIKASSLALRDVPEVNSSWHDTYIRQYKSSDIAVAVATETGLITPIVRNAENKGLATISNAVKSLADKGKKGKLQPSEYQGGTFTISNLGMFGITDFTAIINPPHSSILAVGTTTDKVVVDSSSEKGFRAIKVMKVTLSNDHRVVDGAVGAKFLQKFRGYIENPLTMLL